MRRLLTLLLLLSPACFGYASYSGWCEQGGKTVTVQGIPSTTLVQQSYPNLSGSGSGPNVTVYLTGTSNKATIYSDNAGTALANPFPCTATGQYQFFAGEQVVDLTFAGSGVSSYTISKVPLSEPLGVISDVGGAPESLATLCSRANSAGRTLTIALAWESESTETLNCTKQFFQGGIIQPASSQVITVSGLISAPSGQKIFDTSLGGTGSILLPTPQQDVWWNWFGTDDVAGNAMIAAVAAGAAQPKGVTLRAACGTYALASTVTVSSNYMLRLHGSGACTNFNWTGNNSSPMFLIQDNLQSEFGDFLISSSTSAQLLYGIQQQNSGSGTRWTSTLVRYINIQINGTNGGVTTGVYLGGGTDGNNDQQYFESVSVSNYSHSGFTINHSQIYDPVFNHSTFLGDGFGSYGVEALAGNFHWMNGDGGGNQLYDFYITGIDSAADTIEKGRFEGSGAFLVTAGPSYNTLALSLRDVNFSADKLGCTAMQISGGTCPGTPPGGYAIVYKFAGPFSMDNCVFGTSASVPLKIELQVFDATHPNTASIRSTTFNDSLNTTATIFDTGAPTSLFDVVAFNPGADTGVNLFLSAVVAPVTLAASAIIDVTNYPKGQLFLTPSTGSPSYNEITGEYDGYYFFVACRDSADNCVFTSNTHNIQFAGSLSPLTLHYENTAQFVCFSGVCTLVTAQ